jgi:hypothetical protein
MKQVATQHRNKKLFVFDAGHGLDLLHAQHGLGLEAALPYVS